MKLIVLNTKSVMSDLSDGIKEVAINLLDLLDDEIIALKTGLSIEEVCQLRKENNSR